MSLVRVRRSQIITTYGPGALIDLPDQAVLVAGLERWIGEAKPIHEARLLANLRRRLGVPHLDLKSPPAPSHEGDEATGLVAFEFPEWFLAQYETRTKEHGRSRPLVHRRALKKRRYVADDPLGKRRLKDWPVVPVRFVEACPNGHVSDIDWPALIHGKGVGCAGQLWLDEQGTTGDLSELFLRCDGCKRPRIPLMQLKPQEGKPSLLGPCRGERPWLGPVAREECKGPGGKPHQARLLIRHASNAYFPIIERAISIPDHDERVRKAVDSVWEDFLSVAESAADVKRERKKQRVAQALEGLTDAEVWAECARRQVGDEGRLRLLKDVELDTFLSAQVETVGKDEPDSDFFAKRSPLDASRTGEMALVERIVLIHRLREVVTELGFTRFEPLGAPVEEEVNIGVERAPLALETRWLPAVENRGEGFFLSIAPAAVSAWLERPEVAARARSFREGVRRATHKEEEDVTDELLVRTYMPYVMLHSLSHLLLTAIVLECGYAAASIRERIYVREGAYGILLYTGTPDSEGTLGGLVHVGRALERHVKRALELGRLCSNDPVCAQHRPDRRLEDRPTHGAACHGCLLIAEPSCERRNELLDRSLVIPTVDNASLAFFS